MIQEACAKAPPPPNFPGVPYESPVTAFLEQQDPMDVLRYVNSKTPVDEFFLDAAMELLASQVGMLEEYLDADIDAFQQVWAEIERRVRARSREKRRAEKAAQKTEQGG